MKCPFSTPNPKYTLLQTQYPSKAWRGAFRGGSWCLCAPTVYRHGVRAPLPPLEGECRGGGHLPLVCCTPRALHKASRLRVLDIHEEWIHQQKGRPSSRLGLPSPHGGAPKLLRGLLILRAPQRAWHTTGSQMTPAGPNNPRALSFSTQ